MSQPSQLLLGISPPQTDQRTLFPGGGGERDCVIDGGKISKQVWKQTSRVSEGKSNLVSDADKQSRSENSRQQCCLCVPTQRKKNLLYASFLTFLFSSSSRGLWEDRPARVRELNRPRGGSSHFLWHRRTQTHSEMQNALFLFFFFFLFTRLLLSDTVKTDQRRDIAEASFVCLRSDRLSAGHEENSHVHV